MEGGRGLAAFSPMENLLGFFGFLVFGFSQKKFSKAAAVFDSFKKSRCKPRALRSSAPAGEFVAAKK